MGGARRISFSSVCSSGGAGHRAGGGTGRGGELSPALAVVFGGVCGLCNVLGGEGAWRDGR